MKAHRLTEELGMLPWFVEEINAQKVKGSLEPKPTIGTI